MEASKRAQRIVRTETSAALNAGHQVEVDVLEAAGLPVIKTWTAVGDRDVRDSHAAMDGRQIRCRENFNLAGILSPTGPLEPTGPRTRPLSVWNIW